MLFYFNNNVCRDLPYVIYHKQYVTVDLKLHNLRLALGMNIKTVRLCIKTGFRVSRIYFTLGIQVYYLCVDPEKFSRDEGGGGRIQCIFW